MRRQDASFSTRYPVYHMNGRRIMPPWPGLRWRGRRTRADGRRRDERPCPGRRRPGGRRRRLWCAGDAAYAGAAAPRGPRGGRRGRRRGCGAGDLPAGLPCPPYVPRRGQPGDLVGPHRLASLPGALGQGAPPRPDRGGPTGGPAVGESGLYRRPGRRGRGGGAPRRRSAGASWRSPWPACPRRSAWRCSCTTRRGSRSGRSRP